MTAEKEMPRYQSHKKVWALKIALVEVHADASATISPEETGYGTFRTRVGWADRFNGDEDDLGYFVEYDDGFTSWSPTKPFEEGYTRL